MCLAVVELLTDCATRSVAIGTIRGADCSSGERNVGLECW